MNERYRAAIYCRLSKDDEQIGDSVSIETQKMMLTSYCVNQGFEVVEIYIDDGYSGLNFNRPAFKRLITDLEAGKIDIVITKDLSRLGRDYIQTGYYIDIYFAAKRIRYIAVNDGIDTFQDNNDIAPFKNILNDMYAKDLSRKVKTAKRQRAEKGLYISAQPPYGYKVDPCNKNKLIVDPEPACVVRLIFELALSGKSFSEISRILEKRKIVSPSNYKVMNGDTRFLRYTYEDRMYKWSYQTVKSILCNPVYVGDMVNHKVEITNYKTKERSQVPIEKRIVVSNTHEAIIDRNIFDEINSLPQRRKPNHNYKNELKGFVFCGECGEEMQLIARGLKEETKPMFRCPKHAKDPSSCSHNHFIYYDELLNEITKQCSIHMQHFVNSHLYDELCVKIVCDIMAQSRETEKKRIQEELYVINRSIRNKQKAADTSESTLELAALYKSQKRLLKELTLSPDYLNADNIDISNFKSAICELLNSIHINQPILRLLIERIEIGHLEKDPAKGTFQKIKISYKFDNFLLDR